MFNSDLFYFQNMKVIPLLLTSICMFNLMSMGRGECEDQFIERHAWQENGVETYCCMKVAQNCKPGIYIVKYKLKIRILQQRPYPLKQILVCT